MAENQLITSLLRPFFRKGKSSSFLLPGQISDRARVLAIDSGDLSDLLFHVPLLKGIRDQYPGSEIDFLLPEEHSPLVISSGLARQCLVYRPQQLKPWTPGYAALLRTVRKSSYDVVLLMTLDSHPDLELAALASGAPLRFGPSHKGNFPAINFEVRPPEAHNRYLGLRPLSAAAFFGLAPGTVKPGWPLPEDKQRKMKQLIHFNKPRKDELLVGVDPGIGKSGFGFSLPNLRFLVRQLTSQTLCRILPLSDPHNQERLRKFEEMLNAPPNGLARDTLLETVLLLANCNLFIARNTDLFHFAVALQVPTLGLFTPKDESKWEPDQKDHVRILRVSKGERVDIDTLMEAVESITYSQVAP